MGVWESRGLRRQLAIERFVEPRAALPRVVDAHRAAPHFKELGRKLGDYLAGRPEVQVMQEV